MTTPSFSYLALGDSYTIGEGVPLYESFPYQTVQLLRKAGKPFAAPEILARTGWTTDELAAAMADSKFLPPYDFVSLLIGVNNQYRGRDHEEYGRQFEELLQQAIRLATPRSHPSPTHSPFSTPPPHPSSTPPGPASPPVFVLSIPDWSVTPFAQTHLPDAKGRDRISVSREIDTFNATAEEITRRYQVAFINITDHTRSECRYLPEAPADGLHPSGIEYGFWATQLAERIATAITTAQ
ncbi:MAG TPA: GDSL-type esterase/lipase family protein [Puia sp.]